MTCADRRRKRRHSSSGFYAQSGQSRAGAGQRRNTRKMRTTRAIIVNAGNANCCTGERGWITPANVRVGRRTKSAVHRTKFWSVRRASSAINCRWIKSKTPSQRIELGRGDEFSEATARAVMTTDIVPKFCAAQR